MDGLEKAERYAMIRRIARNNMNRQQSQRRVYHSTKKRIDRAIDILDDQSSIHWNDTDRYLESHYGDVIEANREKGDD